MNNSGAIVGTATYTPTGTTDPIAAGSHGVLLLPASFNLRSNNNISQGWDGTGWDETTSKAANPPWTCVGVGQTNSLVKLMLPGYPSGNSMGLQLVVAQDGSQNKISLTNNTISGSETDFNIVGNAAGTASIQLQLQSTGQVLLTLNVTVLAPQTVTVDVHIVTDSNSSATDIPSGLSSTFTPTQVVAELNAVFGPQANITFQLGDTSAENIHYDLNGNGILDTATELQFFSQPKPGHLQIYEVLQIHSPNGDAGGITTEGQGPCVLAYSSAHPLDWAHEVGHALNLSTVNDPTHPSFHDEGPWPAEFQTDGLNDPSQVGVMYWQDIYPHVIKWLRQEDWSAANDTATTQYH